MDSTKITAVANTAGTLLVLDTNRFGARVQNPFSVPIYVSKVSPPEMGSGSIHVPAANSVGEPGEYIFDGPCYETWYYITAASGAFGLQWW